MSECTDWMTEVRWKLASVSAYGRLDVYEGLNVARNEVKRNWGWRERLHSRSITQYFWWRCGQGTHPFPSRTRWLRPDRPMVLHWRRCGRAGGRQIIKSLIWKKEMNWFLPVIKDQKRFWFLMTDKHQSDMYIENCIQKINQFSNRERHPRWSSPQGND